jgi:hypothetical protein
MRILPSRSSCVRSFALLVVVLAAGSMSCENKHVGRACALSVDPDPTTGGTTTTIDVGLECPSRICLLPTRESVNSNPLTGSLCTADCSSDDDCSDGELRGTSNPNGCEHGFVCKVAETVGDFCCRKLCVCKDFSGTPPAGGFQTPEVCKPTSENKAICQNI